MSIDVSMPLVTFYAALFRCLVKDLNGASVAVFYPLFSPGPTFIKVTVKKDKHTFIIHLKDPKEIVKKGKKEEDYSSEDVKENREEEQNLETGKQ